MSSTGHRIAPSPAGGIVLVSLYSWTSVTLLVTAARCVIGLIHKVKFDWDDATLICGTIVYTASAIPWHVAVTQGGLGEPFRSVSADRAAKYFKFSWAAQLLQMAAMSFAKCSSAFLTSRIASQSRCEQLILFGTVALWTLSSLLLFGLQCGLPRPWSNVPACSRGGPVFTVIALNMLSDALLAWWIVPIIRPLKIDRERRRSVIILFASRGIIPFVSAGQLWVVAKIVRGGDPTHDRVANTVLSQTVSSLSLIVASLPRIKRFVGSAGSGMLNARITASELALTTHDRANIASDTGGISLKLLPSNSTKLTTPVESDDNKKKRPKQSVGDKFIPMGKRPDEHNSTSSLLDQSGVITQQEDTVCVEGSHRGLAICTRSFVDAHFGN
ncbi:hypothetical protein DM02DRAFT_670697 [Periconia macrospinosa]|uniref:Rhodopsin domain-containing protein n=1 Tax=Periconia macrospinosa TaxID=97972 RepID=A0A2V1DZE0_9PLEO|nr:hypothetical protein DM02DRAFT_670697 [Periconia macrospinosa]